MDRPSSPALKEDVSALRLESRPTHNTLQIAECSEASWNGMQSAVTQQKELLDVRGAEQLELFAVTIQIDIKEPVMF